jgi:PadR family transcriptional regulator
MARNPGDLLYGTLDILVLKALSWQPMHGYAISGWLDARTGRHLEIEDGALYKSLHRMEEQGEVAAEWGVSENNRKAKYYRLTAAGRRRLREESAAWHSYARVVARVLRTA